MKIRQAYRFQLKPTPKQRRNLARFAGCKRFVYNKALALQKQKFESGGKRLGYAGLCKQLTQWRHDPETSFLALAPTHPLQQALKDSERAYQNFSAGRSELPRFKKKGCRESFRYPDAKQIKLDQNNARIFLPKLGWIKYRKSRGIKGDLKQVTVVEHCGQWYISIQTERIVDEPQHQHESDTMVGIDLGIVRFATLSDGTVIEAENTYRKQEHKLRKQQRRLARQQKFGQNWRKQKRKIQRTHKAIADSRRDFLHKTSTTISKTHAVVVMEDLRIKAMSASAAGTVENPGKNVRGKAGLNKSILDQGWGEFRRQLEYKLIMRGGVLIVVAPEHTSQRCSVCGHVCAHSRVSQAQFKCVSCGHSENADLNAALNILSAGRADYACGGDRLRFSMKQEPTVSAAHTA